MSSNSDTLGAVALHEGPEPHGALGKSARPKVSSCLVGAFTDMRTEVFS